MSDRRLELVDEPRGTQDYEGLVPPPIPPDDPEAWYAKTVQKEILDNYASIYKMAGSPIAFLW